MIAKTDSTDPDHSAFDRAMIERCIALSATAARNGELPFAAIICKGSEVVAQSGNQVVHDVDITRHAELVAMAEAQKKLGRGQLEGCTLYSTAEPCAMCSFAARETRISRVVFSIRSPVMGGVSKWNVLHDAELSRAMPEVFGPAPEIVAGLLEREAERVWEKSHPVFWAVIKRRGYLGGNGGAGGSEHLPPSTERPNFFRRLFRFHRRNSA